MSIVICTLYLLGCPGNKTKVQCLTDPCLNSSCSVFPDAQCVADYCGECKARFYYKGKEVTDTCGKLVLTSFKFFFVLLDCPLGLVVVSCSPSCLPTCYEPNPVCIPNTDCVAGCGCPDGKVYDQQQQQCVFPSDCGMFEKVLLYLTLFFYFPHFRVVNNSYLE